MEIYLIKDVINIINLLELKFVNAYLPWDAMKQAKQLVLTGYAVQQVVRSLCHYLIL